MANEREQYSKLVKCLGLYGVAHKNKDTYLCTRCGMAVHPPASGVPDYSWGVNGQYAVVEFKAGDDRIEFSQITADKVDKEGKRTRGQREHMTWWQQRSGGTAWLAISVGDAMVTSKRENRNRMWLIDWDTWRFREQSILMQEELKYIPVNPIGHFKHQELTLSSFTQHELLWETFTGWIIPPMHIINRMYGPLTRTIDSVKDNAQQDLTHAHSN